MKKWLCLLLACLLLTGCAPASGNPETTAPSTEPEFAVLSLYVPDEMAEGFEKTEVQVPAITETIITEQLILAGVLAEDTRVNTFELVSASDSQEPLQLRVDFSTAFRDRILSQGTAGEYVTLGSVVNTFLTAYGAQSMVITVEGQTLESGHAVYDASLSFFDPQ